MTTATAARTVNVYDIAAITSAAERCAADLIATWKERNKEQRRQPAWVEAYRAHERANPQDYIEHACRAADSVLGIETPTDYDRITAEQDALIIMLGEHWDTFTGVVEGRLSRALWQRTARCIEAQWGQDITVPRLFK